MYETLLDRFMLDIKQISSLCESITSLKKNENIRFKSVRSAIICLDLDHALFLTWY